MASPTLTEVEDLARRLCYEHEQANVWAVIDEAERLHWRRQSQQRLTARVWCPSLDSNQD